MISSCCSVSSLLLMQSKWLSKVEMDSTFKIFLTLQFRPFSQSGIVCYDFGVALADCRLVRDSAGRPSSYRNADFFSAQ